MEGQESAIDTLSVRRPQPHNPTHSKKEEKGKNSKRQKEIKELWLIKKLWSIIFSSVGDYTCACVSRFY